MAFMVMLVLAATVHLFSVTWASQNAHIRAREAALHLDSYLGSRQAGSGGLTIYEQAPWDTSQQNYVIADPSLCPGQWSGAAHDMARDDLFEQQSIDVQAVMLCETTN